mmetsp:Transcript_17449/g.28233  ORF Transcript_17449/g.28233 Transcript_17449/m.28233 type:complete len:337 (-) Transcript_17449:367-1377(-)
MHARRTEGFGEVVQLAVIGIPSIDEGSEVRQIRLLRRSRGLAIQGADRLLRHVIPEHVQRSRLPVEILEEGNLHRRLPRLGVVTAPETSQTAQARPHAAAASSSALPLARKLGHLHEFLQHQFAVEEYADPVLARHERSGEGEAREGTGVIEPHGDMIPHFGAEDASRQSHPSHRFRTGSRRFLFAFGGGTVAGPIGNGRSDVGVDDGNDERGGVARRSSSRAIRRVRFEGDFDLRSVLCSCGEQHHVPSAAAAAEESSRASTARAVRAVVVVVVGRPSSSGREGLGAEPTRHAEVVLERPRNFETTTQSAPPPSCYRGVGRAAAAAYAAHAAQTA